jgi:hypothetical protein
VAALALAALFLVMAALICSVPYDPEEDLADAVTNDIWVEHYAQGEFSIPYDEWTYGLTQSVVVWHDGQFVVVNEKGPGHALMLVPFYLTGTDQLFGAMMAGIAALSTYMLGRRLLNWKVGAIAAALVMTDVSVVMMWYRSYWTDASTMALLVLSIWLAVEANLWANGGSLDPHGTSRATSRQKMAAAGLAALAGLSFGASVSTRYATALIMLPMLFYFTAFYLTRAWPSLRAARIMEAVRSSAAMWGVLAVFAIGLLCVLVPLMSYNSDYFGGALRSGYDATTLQQFVQLGGTTDRDTSSEWVSGAADNVSTALENLATLGPVLLARMPFMMLLPIGVWFLRKERSALALLGAWIAVNLLTYSSISWVDMYASMPAQILFEPRYFIPAVPPIAILAGAAIVGLVSRIPWKEMGAATASIIASRRSAAALAATAALIMCSLIPAAGFLAAADDMGIAPRGPPQNGLPGDGAQGDAPPHGGPDPARDGGGGEPPPRSPPTGTSMPAQPARNR